MDDKFKVSGVNDDDNVNGLPALGDVSDLGAGAGDVSSVVEPDEISFQPQQAVSSDPVQSVQVPQVNQQPQTLTPPANSDSGNKKVVIGGVLALALLLVGVPLVVLGLQDFNGDIRQRASEPRVTPPMMQEQQQFAGRFVVSGPVSGIVGDSSNVAWRQMGPVNVEAVYDAENQRVLVSWDDADVDPRPEMWLVSFWGESFDPVATFSRFNVQNQVVAYSGVKESSFDSQSVQRRTSLNLSKLSNNTGVVYYALIKRVVIDGQNADFVYGDGGSANVPFSVRLN